MATCVCRDGYTLRDDGRTCAGTVTGREIPEIVVCHGSVTKQKWIHKDTEDEEKRNGQANMLCSEKGIVHHPTHRTPL